MTDRPILFSAPMVRALLEGRKTQTRRVFKGIEQQTNGNWHIFGGLLNVAEEDVPKHAPDYVPIEPGDRLWVREAHYLTDDGDEEFAVYAVDDAAVAEHKAEMERLTGQISPEIIKRHTRLRPGIHMPRWASRLTLTVTDVRVERLQDISEADAIAEGATSRPRCSGFRDMEDGWSMDWSRVGQFSKHATGGPGPLKERDVSLRSARSAFASYMNELHGGPHWSTYGPILSDENPWVIAYTFDTIKQNIDRIEQVAA